MRRAPLIVTLCLAALTLSTCKKKDYAYTFMPTYIYGIDISVEKAVLYIDDEPHGQIVALDHRASVCSEEDLEQCYYVELPFECHNFEVFDHHGNMLVSHPLKFTKTRLKNCSPFDDRVEIEVGDDFGWILSTVFENEEGRHTCIMEFSNAYQPLKGFADLSCL